MLIFSLSTKSDLNIRNLKWPKWHVREKWLLKPQQKSTHVWLFAWSKSVMAMYCVTLVWGVRWKRAPSTFTERMTDLLLSLPCNPSGHNRKGYMQVYRVKVSLIVSCKEKADLNSFFFLNMARFANMFQEDIITAVTGLYN